MIQKTSITKLLIGLKNFYKKLVRLPIYIRYPLGIGLIIIGFFNIPNPLINGIFLMLAGGGLLSTTLYKHLRKMRRIRHPKAVVRGKPLANKETGIEKTAHTK